MKFIPTNKYLQVERLATDEQNSSTFVVPKEFRADTKTTGTEVVRVVFGTDCYEPGSLIVVEATMLEDFVHEEKSYCIVKEQYVKGVFLSE